MTGPSPSEVLALPTRWQPRPWNLLLGDLQDNSKGMEKRKTSNSIKKHKRVLLNSFHLNGYTLGFQSNIFWGTWELSVFKLCSFRFRARKIPIIIRRYLPDGSHEDWAIDELIITDWKMISHYFTWVPVTKFFERLFKFYIYFIHLFALLFQSLLRCLTIVTIIQ